jgi:histidinol-phosphate/aromatic aminotransferase/cobyric acid decarboxylase-like protein
VEYIYLNGDYFKDNPMNNLKTLNDQALKLRPFKSKALLGLLALLITYLPPERKNFYHRYLSTKMTLHLESAAKMRPGDKHLIDFLHDFVDKKTDELTPLLVKKVFSPDDIQKISNVLKHIDMELFNKLENETFKRDDINNKRIILSLQPIKQRLTHSINHYQNEKEKEISSLQIRLLMLLFLMGLTVSLYYQFKKRKLAADEIEIIKSFTDLHRKLLNDYSQVLNLTPKEKTLINDITYRIAFMSEDGAKKQISPDIVYLIDKMKIAALNFNEFYTSIRTEIKEGRYQQVLKTLKPNRYMMTAEAPRKEFGRIFNVSDRRVLLFNGAAAALNVLLKTYGKNKKILTEVPMYGPIINLIKDVAGEVSYFELFSSNSHRNRDLKKLNSEINEQKPDIVLLCNPGNPLGQYNHPLEIWNLAKQHPQTLFIVDEAYIDFIEAKQGFVFDYEKQPSNIVTVRTFSKMFGLAKIRVGFILASKKIIKELKPSHATDDIDGEAGYLVLHALESREAYVKKIILPFIEQNQKLISQYQNYFGADHIFHSDSTNMLTVEVTHLINAMHLSDFRNLLLGKHKVVFNVIAENGDYTNAVPGIEGKILIRVSLSDAKTNKKVFKSLIEAISETKKLSSR